MGGLEDGFVLCALCLCFAAMEASLGVWGGLQVSVLCLVPWSLLWSLLLLPWSPWWAGAVVILVGGLLSLDYPVGWAVAVVVHGGHSGAVVSWSVIVILVPSFLL